MHVGLLYPSGVHVTGYTAEKQISTDVYRFYIFGFHPWPPSVIVTMGISEAQDLPARWVSVSDRCFMGPQPINGRLTHRTTGR